MGKLVGVVAHLNPGPRQVIGMQEKSLYCYGNRPSSLRRPVRCLLEKDLLRRRELDEQRSSCDAFSSVNYDSYVDGIDGVSKHECLDAEFWHLAVITVLTTSP